jgi:molecular chaperone DnaK
MPHTIGIDLGTTNSVLAFYERARAEVIPNSEGSKITPSVVCYREGEEPIIGELAKRQLIVNSEQTIFSVKRLIGRRFSELSEEGQRLPYKIRATPEDGIEIDLGWARVSPEQASAEILKKMKRSAEDYLGEQVPYAIVTVPAYFNDNQRSATKRAAELAGLEVLRIINEPTAAALAYGLNRKKSERIAVFDFGGGTFDISILELDEDVFEVKATNGDTFLGGDDIDRILMDYVCERIVATCECDVRGLPQELQRIREMVEKVKCELSFLPATTLNLPFIQGSNGSTRHYTEEITREKFNDLMQPVLSRLVPPCQKALEDANVSPEEIDRVILVGGSTRIPAVQEIVKQTFGKEPAKVINPDEAVAVGAAIQAAVMSGSLAEVLLLDVTPLSLGIELEAGVFSVIIPRNSSIPTTATKRFTTTRDNQTSAFIHVLQGERKIAQENMSLAHFRLTGITSAPREIAEIQVKFHIDANGILSVSAMDVSSGAKKEMVVETYAEALNADFDHIVGEAEEKAEEDRVTLARAQRRLRINRFRNMVSTFAERERDKISPEDQDIIRQALVKLDFAVEQNDSVEIERQENVLLELGEHYHDLFFAYKLVDNL